MYSFRLNRFLTLRLFGCYKYIHAHTRTHTQSLTLWRILYSFFCYFVSSAVCVCVSVHNFCFLVCVPFGLYMFSLDFHFIFFSSLCKLTFMIVIWNWNAHKVFNNSEWSFFSPSNDIIYEQKGLPFFHMAILRRSCRKKGMQKKQHTDRDTHTHTHDLWFFSTSFRISFSTFLTCGLLLAECVPVNLFSAFWLLFGFLFANFHAYAVVLYWKSNFRVLFFMLTKCSIYRQDFS